MKLNKLTCPNCNAQLNIKLENGKEEIFCSYCGQKFLIDDETKKINININKSIVDEAKIIREKNKEKEDKRNFVVLIIIFLISILTLAIIWGGLQINKIMAEKEGKTSAGSYIELIGKDYKSVAAHLKAAGFTNIELIDLNDSEIMFWNNGKVETISIGGNTSFDTTSYFNKDIKIIISYH